MLIEFIIDTIDDENTDKDMQGQCSAYYAAKMHAILVENELDDCSYAEEKVVDEDNDLSFDDDVYVQSLLLKRMRITKTKQTNKQKMSDPKGKNKKIELKVE